jgi:asparagine synthase (glutamine-hydrolysing)
VARRIARRAVDPPWLAPSWLERAAIARVSPVPRPRGEDTLRQVLWETLRATSLPMLLRYEDRNSMAYSIESRVPFLTTEIAEFVLSLPESYLIAGDGTGKAVFRRAMRGIVPDLILDRRDKIGFATPEKRWLSELRSWVDGILASEAAHRVPAIDLPRAREEWALVLGGLRRFDWHVWRWINTIRWVEQLGVSFDV